MEHVSCAGQVTMDKIAVLCKIFRIAHQAIHIFVINALKDMVERGHWSVQNAQL